MDILTYKTAHSTHTLSSRTGLVVLGELIRRLKLSETVDRLMPKTERSNRTYRSSTIVNTFMLMLHEGGRSLDDVRRLRDESALLNQSN